MPKVNETWALAKSTVNYFCRLMNGAEFGTVQIPVDSFHATSGGRKMVITHEIH
jgi:hypothetical protein